MKCVGFSLTVAALLLSVGSLSGTADGRFDQKLSKEKQVVHVLNRLTFGPRPGDIDRVRRTGIEKWIQQQLQPHLIAENPVVNASLQPLETLRLATWQILEKYQPTPALVAGFVGGIRPSWSQLLSPEQLRKLSTGTTEQRLSVIGSIAAEDLKALLPALTPRMLEGLPELQKQAEAARRAESERQQAIRRLNPSLNDLLSSDQRRIAQQGRLKKSALCSCPSLRRRVARFSGAFPLRRSQTFPNCAASRSRHGNR